MADQSTLPTPSSSLLLATLGEKYPEMLTTVEAIETWLQPAWLLDAQFRVLHVNRALLDLVGVERRDEWALNWPTYIHPDDLPGVEKAWLEARTTSRPHVDQRRMRNRHGQWRWMSAQTLPASFNSEHVVTHWVGMASDIHEEKISAERLARLQKITADLSVAVSSTDVGHRILSHGIEALGALRAVMSLVDETGQRLLPVMNLNCPRELLAAYDQTSLEFPNSLNRSYLERRTVFLRDAATIAATDPASGPLLAMLPKQQALLILPLNAKEKALGALAFFYEVSFEADDGFLKFAESIADLCAQALERSFLFEQERNARAEAEQERARLALVLIEQVGARKELEENRTKLNAAKEEAESANRAKTAFVANMSHEFRTPLSAILGFSEFLASDLTPAKRSYFAEGIRRNGQALLKLVDDILDLSRVEAGKINIEVQSFAPKFLIKDAVALFKEEAAKKEVKLATKGLDRLPALFASDPVRLRQILLNLIGNALKFTESGSVIVEVAPSAPDASSGAAPNASLEILVHDTGIGLTPEQASRLFQAFGQADRHTRRKYGGTGLGLFISSRLAVALEGDLSLRTTEPGKGSVFSLRLKSLDSQATRLWTVDPNAPLAQACDLRGRRVLVVEDTRDLRNLLRAHLERAGADVDVARDGQDGLMRASDGEHDIVLMDLSMPVMDGYTATQRLRKDGYRRPIVAITAHAHPEDRARCFESGFDAYLTKPLNLRELETTIRRLLSRVEPARQS